MLSADPVFIFLPVVVVLLTVASFVRPGREHPLAEALVKTHLLILMFVGIVTEVLSLAGRLNFSGVAMAWMAAAIVIVPFAARTIRSLLMVLRGALVNPAPVFVWFFAAGVGILAGMTLVAGCLYPPNTWDAMTYHLPRAMPLLRSNALIG